MPPSLTTEAKTLKRCPFCGDAMQDRGYGAMHIDGKGCPVSDLAFDVEKWNRRTVEPSLLSLIEDMAKALEAFSNLSEVFKHRTVTRPASGDDPIFAWADHRVNDGEALVITVGDLMKARSALSRYTEFMEKNNG